MLVAVALVKDTRSNIERFLDLNLKNGADGILLFLDAGAQPLVGPLPHHEHVTVVPLDDWWAPGAEPPLNGRQRIVANLARVACARVDHVDWLFFIDGDEVALIDRAVLGSVPDEVVVARLTPLESISDPGTEESLFKRLLTEEELRRLARAGLVSRPTNARHFRGHLSGKVGVRPRSDARFWIHTAVDAEGDKLPAFGHPALRLLHFESTSFEEFVRKWNSLATSGAPPGMRGRRRKILDAFLELQSLPAEEQRVRHVELYDQHVREDGRALLEADVLERVDLDEVRSLPRAYAADRMADLAAELALLRGVPKRLFLPEAPHEALRDAIERGGSAREP